MYIAGWAEERDPHGRGAGASCVPLEYEAARKWLLNELRRNMPLWAQDGLSRARFESAIKHFENAPAGQQCSYMLPDHRQAYLLREEALQI